MPWPTQVLASEVAAAVASAKAACCTLTDGARVWNWVDPPTSAAAGGWCRLVWPGYVSTGLVRHLLAYTQLAYSGSGVGTIGLGPGAALPVACLTALVCCPRACWLLHPTGVLGGSSTNGVGSVSGAGSGLVMISVHGGAGGDGGNLGSGTSLGPCPPLLASILGPLLEVGGSPGPSLHRIEVVWTAAVAASLLTSGRHQACVAVANAMAGVDAASLLGSDSPATALCSAALAALDASCVSASVAGSSTGSSALRRAADLQRTCMAWPAQFMWVGSGGRGSGSMCVCGGGVLSFVDQASFGCCLGPTLKSVCVGGGVGGGGWGR